MFATDPYVLFLKYQVLLNRPSLFSVSQKRVSVGSNGMLSQITRVRFPYSNFSRWFFTRVFVCVRSARKNMNSSKR